MRLIVFLLLVAFALPVFAQAPVSIDNIWRSDIALNDAETLIKDKKYAEALTVLDKIVARNMRNADAHVDSAIAWYNLGALEKAKNAVGNALAIDRGHLGAYMVGAIIALRERERTQAEYYLGAIRTICQSELCTEYQVLQKAIRESKLEE